MRRTLIGVLLLLALCVGCRTAHVRPDYTVEYPFTAKSANGRVVQVRVDVSRPELFNPAPMSIVGLWHVHARVLAGEIPRHPGRRSFVMAVRQDPVTDAFFQKGGGKLTLCFDENGEFLYVKEFADSFQQDLRSQEELRLKPSFPGR